MDILKRIAEIQEETQRNLERNRTRMEAFEEERKDSNERFEENQRRVNSILDELKALMRERK